MASTRMRSGTALLLAAAVLGTSACGIGEDRWTFEDRDGLLVAVHHGTTTATAGVGVAGPVHLVDGCWRLGSSYVAWPEQARWSDASHTAVRIGDRTIADGDTLGDRAGGTELERGRPGIDLTGAPCVPAAGDVSVFRLDELG